VLFGDYNPSGKLPVTFYKNAQQLPDFEDYRMAGRTYRYFKGDALFPFGYGLSYTTFEIGKPIFMKNKLLVKVKNTGQNDGSEVVQVYVRNPRDLNGPLKTLRCYKRIHLKAGEQTTLSIDVPNSSFELWDSRSNTMRVVPGKYELMVGNSSRDADLKKITVRIK
jgi:beta-glucosidase